MVRFYWLLCLLFVGKIGWAQGLPGYVLTTVGDTLRGDVVEKSGQRVHFYPAGDEPVQHYRPSQLRGYGLRNHAPILSKVVQLATGADSARFVLLQTAGPASLYSFANDQGLLLGMGTDTLYELTAVNWHVVLNRHLRACASLRHTAPELMALPFSEADIRRVLVRYNTCVEPQWQSRPHVNYSGWRKAVGVHLGMLRTGERSLFDQESYIQTRQAGLEWGGIRASGLQSGIQLGYVNITGRTRAVQVQGPNKMLLEERQIYRSHTISPALTVGKRFGRMRRPNFYLGGGLGLALNIHDTRETQQRAAGSNTDFQRVSTTGNAGVGELYATVSTGVLLTLPSDREVRLNAMYQRFLISDITLLGVQLAYYWLLK
ncbi:hypothetical protein LGH70_07480 [Hymenobacter sp. BT635]|uniref:Outer membrane protein beta-barrel domain-containing protein n=1 Tax=Hymenobacter nitidus TaxID=2880929 RepID=A0ABS8AAW6_9BACT|nr:hypothetical protein [Hymenobacter nitidus]MCB2377416.1 hypothetical protein [Hymenobacter nitidus]